MANGDIVLVLHILKDQLLSNCGRKKHNLRLSTTGQLSGRLCKWETDVDWYSLCVRFGCVLTVEDSVYLSGGFKCIEKE